VEGWACGAGEESGGVWECLSVGVCGGGWAVGRWGGPVWGVGSLESFYLGGHASSSKGKRADIKASHRRS